MYPDDESLVDILNRAKSALELMDDLTFDQFITNKAIKLAVSHELIIMGEACRRLSRELRESHPEIDWQKWMRLRNAA